MRPPVLLPLATPVPVIMPSGELSFSNAIQSWSPTGIISRNTNLNVRPSKPEHGHHGHSFICSLLSGEGMSIGKSIQMITNQLPDDVSQYVVTKLEHVKMLRSMSRTEHEDVIATVVHRKTSHTERISFGRFKGHVADADRSREKKPSKFTFGFASIDNHASATSKPSASIISNAKDIVRMLHDKEETPPSTIVFTPGGDSLPLLHLIFIAEEVHQLAPEYSVFTRQCYWFAMMVMAISMLEGGNVEEATYPSKRKANPQWKNIMVSRFPVSEDEETNLTTILNLPRRPPDEIDLKKVLPVVKTEAGKHHGVRIIRRIDCNRIWSSAKEARRHYENMIVKFDPSSTPTKF